VAEFTKSEFLGEILDLREKGIGGGRYGGGEGDKHPKVFEAKGNPGTRQRASLLARGREKNEHIFFEPAKLAK